MSIKILSKKTTTFSINYNLDYLYKLAKIGIYKLKSK